MRTFGLFLALVGVMGMSLMVLEERRAGAADTKELADTKAACTAKLLPGQSFMHLAADEVFLVVDEVYLPSSMFMQSTGGGKY